VPAERGPGGGSVTAVVVAGTAAQAAVVTEGRRLCAFTRSDAFQWPSDAAGRTRIRLARDFLAAAITAYDDIDAGRAAPAAAFPVLAGHADARPEALAMAAQDVAEDIAALAALTGNGGDSWH